MITVINTVEAKEQFTDLVNRVAHNKEHIVLTRRGKEIVAMIPLDDFLLLQASQDEHDLEEASESLKEARSIGMLSIEQLKQDLKG